MRRLIKISLVVLGALLIAILIVANPALDVPAGALSQKYYQPGPHKIETQSLSWTDPNRPTMANHDFKGRESRELKGRMWFPADKAGAPYPLLVYSHGYMSQHKE